MEKLTVGIGELKLATGQTQLIAYALGSCVALCLYDPRKKIGAMGHILLPGNRMNLRRSPCPPAYYADEAVPNALQKMTEAGCGLKHILAAMVGGARMFTYGKLQEQDIGQMNVDAVRVHLQKYEIPLRYCVTGGKHARTVLFSIQENDFFEQIKIREARNVSFDRK